MCLNEGEIYKILFTLSKMYPDAHCQLNYRNPFELLIATILSAQSTDVQVNKVTKNLFKKFPTPFHFLKLKVEDLEKYLLSLGLYRSKSVNILKTCKTLVTKYKGEVPSNREELESLAGVGRKTASVVLANAFKIQAFPVDTHVHRVSNRLLLVKSKNVRDTEKQLTEIVPKKYWIKTHHRLIWHGRQLCLARKPKCYSCDLLNFCSFGNKNLKEEV